MVIDKKKLTGVEKVYPLNVSPYEQYMGDFQSPSVVSKINAMIQSLHQIGRLTNETVSQWNNVMRWIVEGGMDEIAETITIKKVDEALKTLTNTLNLALDNGLKDLAIETVDIKINDLLTSGQFETLVRDSLFNLNVEIKESLEGFEGRLESNIKNLKNRSINVITEGCIGDGITNDTAKIKEIVSKLVEGQTIFFPKGYTFLTTETIVFPVGVNIEMDGLIQNSSNLNQPIVVVGEPTKRNENVKISINVKRSLISDWLNENDVGARIYNLYSSRLQHIGTTYSTIGMELVASDNNGVVYNEISLGKFVGHYKALKLNSLKLGWVNENVFVNGRFSQLSNSMNGRNRYGVWIDSEDGTYPNNNNNVFIKPSFELNALAAIKDNPQGEAIPVVIVHGSQNSIIEARNEGNSSTAMRAINDSNVNFFHAGYGRGVVDNAGRYITNYVKSKVFDISQTWTTIFNSGNLLDKFKIDETGRISIENVNIYATAAEKPLESTSSGINKTSKYVEVLAGRAISIRVSTELVKRFTVKREVNPLRAGRVAVVCYDLNGVKLGDENPKTLRSQADKTMGVSTVFQKSFVTGSDGTASQQFLVGEDVKWIDICLYGCDIKAFLIESHSNAGELSIPYKFKEELL